MQHLFGKVVRIFASPASDPGDGSFNIVIDVLLDGTGKIQSRLPYFGAWGNIATAMMPFVLQSDGDIDFGDADGGENRIGRTTLRSKKSKMGSILRYIGMENIRSELIA